MWAISGMFPANDKDMKNSAIVKSMLIVFTAAILLFAPMAAAGEVVALLPVSYGTIVVHNNTAYVEIKGNFFVIEKENVSYVQFEGRHIKMYNIIIEWEDDHYAIDFKAFRLLDALV